MALQNTISGLVHPKPDISVQVQLSVSLKETVEYLLCTVFNSLFMVSQNYIAVFENTISNTSQ